jgi:hypothetical protein
VEQYDDELRVDKYTVYEPNDIHPRANIAILAVHKKIKQYHSKQSTDALISFHKIHYYALLTIMLSKYR